MRLLKSKKGIGVAIVSDVLSVLVYFMFFIIVIFLISRSQSQADVQAEILKVDFNLELLNLLRAPVQLEDGTNTTVAEYMAELADTSCSTPVLSPLAIPASQTQQQIMATYQARRDALIKEADNVLKQAGPFFKDLESQSACIAVGEIQNCDMFNKISSKFSSCSWYMAKPYRIDVIIPTKEKKLINVSLKTEKIPVGMIVAMVGGALPTTQQAQMMNP